MQLGVSTMALMDEPLDRDLLERIKAAGAASVELTDYHPTFDYADIKAFSVLRSSLDNLGLELNSLHAHLKYLDPECDLAATDRLQREHVVTSYRRAIDTVRAVGGGILVTHDNLIPNVGEPDHADRKVALLENLAKIAAYGSNQGVPIAVENHPNGYFQHPEHLVALLEEIETGNVGICIDTGHRNLCGDPAQAIRIAGKHLITVHIHDNHGERDEHLLPMRGAIDWDDVFDALGQIGYPGTFMYEISKPEDLAELEGNYQSLMDKRENPS